MKSVAKREGLIPTMNHLIQDFFSTDIMDWNRTNFAALDSTLPTVNIKETAKNFKIEVAAPGLKKEDFDINLKNHVLSIKAEHEENKVKTNKKENFSHREYNYQSFCRTFNLPETANDEKINTTYKNGILNISVAKKQADSPKSKKSIY